MPHESLTHIQRQHPTPEKSQAELRSALEKKLLASKPALDAGIAEYKQALADDTFEDQPNEPEGSGEARKQALQKKLLSMAERAKKMKAQLDSKEPLPNTQEADTTTLEPFLKEIFEQWYDATTTQVVQKPITIAPSDLDYPALKTDIDPTKFGEYTLNPECIGIDYEKEKHRIKTIHITQEPGYQALPTKDLASVAQYIIDTYSSKYILPDLSFYEWVIKNPTKAPQSLKDGNWHFTFGSVLRSRGGAARVPRVGWGGTVFHRNASGLGDGWRGSDRVVLLERL